MNEDKTLMFLNIKREVLPGDTNECDLCGVQLRKEYWKYGLISVTLRAAHLCDYCHEAIKD